MAKHPRPKVLFLTHVGEPGGAEYAMLSLCAGLKADGRYQPGVLMLADGSLTRLVSALGVPLQVSPAPTNLQTIRREDGLLTLFRAVPGMLMLLRELIRIARQYDVLIPVSQKSFMLLAMVKAFLRKPVVWYMNDLITRDHFSNAMIWLMVGAANRSANRVIVNSEASRAAWIKAGGDEKKVSISYSGIDVEAFDAAIGSRQQVDQFRASLSCQDQPVIAMVGRISPWKGQHIFLEALAKIPGVIGVIVGDALFGERDYEASLYRYVQTRGLEKRVQFLGHRSDIPRILAAADLVVHCSTAPEPFGRVIVEAMLAGTPVIAANSGGPREIIEPGKSGALVAPGKPALLQAAIEAYLHNPDASQRIAAEARRQSEQRFSCTVMVNSLVEHLDELVPAQHFTG